jgi:integrase
VRKRLRIGRILASDEFGQPYHPNLLTFRWDRMLDGQGIQRVRLHDARHSCATLVHLRQVSIAVIAGVARTRNRGFHAVGLRP